MYLIYYIFVFFPLHLLKLINKFYTLTGSKNKELSVIKIEPEELYNSNFIETPEAETTCCTSKSLQNSKKYSDNITGKFFTRCYI